MKNLKIKFGLFSLLAILAASVFLTSCEQEVLLPEKMDDVKIQTDEYLKYLGTTPKLTLVQEARSVPERTAENTSNMEITDRMHCLQYNSWNYFEQTGWIYVYQAPASWVWSDKYQDFIYLSNEADICDYGLMFHSNYAICGKTTWFWDFNANDTRLWYWNGSQWLEINTATCPGFTG